MSEATQIHLGDIGTIFEITVLQDGVALDISTATLKQFIYRKPTGAVVTKTAVFSTTGIDGKLRYTTIAADLDVIGAWQAQVYLEMPTGKWHTATARFWVRSNLE